MDQENKEISIIITTYNRIGVVGRAIASALNQSYSNVEVIVVDDGSVDGTSEYIKKEFGDKIKLITFSENKGATEARNTGIREATGDYFIVWDSDDVLYKDAVFVLVGFANEMPDMITISAPAKVFLGSEVVEFKPIEEGELSIEKIVCADMPKYKLVRMSRTSVRDTVRYKAKNLDFMFNNELAKAGPWYHVQMELGDHFLNSDVHSLTRKRKKPNIENSIVRAVPLYNHLKEFESIYLNNCPVHYANYAYGASLGLLLSDYKEKAIEMADIAFKYDSSRRNKILKNFLRAPFSKEILYVTFLLRQVC